MKKAGLLLIALSILLVSCPTQTPGRLGSLILTLSTTEMKAKTFVPPLDMEVHHYDVSGTGPDSAAFSQTGVTGGSAVQNALLVGAWTITVNAFNEGGTLIGTGSAAVAIEAGQTSSVSVTVTPLSGKGILAVNISWTAGLIATPSVVASLTPVGGIAQALPFTPGTDSMSYSSGSTLDMGYYWLQLELRDGAVATWGSIESVRILKDQTTTASFSLTEQNINTGSANVTIIPAIQNPITITFTGQESQLPPAVDMTVSAAFSETGVACQWYLNGQLLSGETNTSITIGSALAKGNYRLDLGVTKGNVISSDHVQFSVLDAPTQIVTTNAGEDGTQLDVYLYKGPQFAGNPLYTVWVEGTGGAFIQDLFVCNSPATNVYKFTAPNWVARPEASPYWAHKACALDPYAGPPRTHDSQGMYLGFPTADGGPIPVDLDAVTGATPGYPLPSYNLLLHSKRKDDALTQFRVMLEINRSYDYNATYDSTTYNAGGQPSLVYGVTVRTDTSDKLYTMSLLGAGHALGADGDLHPTDQCTTALEMVGQIIVHVR
jgi:hypothetical protein